MSDGKEDQEILLATANGPAATAAVPAPSKELSDEERAVEIGTKTDCVKHLDALMFCYSPANQVGDNVKETRGRDGLQR
ncbi:Hypothetical Protein FCC1311_081182 [Hondaea fermentalgiana]|uniref:Uncharacterized protein n=1 Tax=Hondaea fermentalgiana TaxID=2315210 RepID=A0A2R5GTB2_9STRA|nr:Hypothetical Protein FCC1311_081182 [Hondaea fermentalgiana]|eukprot:GBG31893.1 Hypothetical Protein FCC1311_081182 [Hondaea fermentalgiana]